MKLEIPITSPSQQREVIKECIYPNVIKILLECSKTRTELIEKVNKALELVHLQVRNLKKGLKVDKKSEYVLLLVTFENAIRSG